MVELPQRPGGPAAAAVMCEARAASAMPSDMPSAGLAGVCIRVRPILVRGLAIMRPCRTKSHAGARLGTRVPGGALECRPS